MDKTLIVGSPNINGNVGSCEVKSVQFEKNFFVVENIETNSCTGQIVAQNIYFDFGIPIATLGMGILIWLLVINPMRRK